MQFVLLHQKAKSLFARFVVILLRTIMSTPAIAVDGDTIAMVHNEAVLPIAEPTIQMIEVTAPATLEAGM
jgi:hypothetical protein